MNGEKPDTILIEDSLPKMNRFFIEFDELLLS